MKVLVVDDSLALRTRLIQMLREVCGAESVREAADADGALTQASTWVPDVVVLDLHMPGTSGLAILPRIREALPSCVVIVLTNEASEPHRRESLSRGADHFFDKSKDFDRVAQVVGAMLTTCGETSDV